MRACGQEGSSSRGEGHAANECMAHQVSSRPPSGWQGRRPAAERHQPNRSGHTGSPAAPGQSSSNNGFPTHPPAPGPPPGPPRCGPGGAAAGPRHAPGQRPAWSCPPAWPASRPGLTPRRLQSARPAARHRGRQFIDTGASDAAHAAERACCERCRCTTASAHAAAANCHMPPAGPLPPAPSPHLQQQPNHL